MLRGACRGSAAGPSGTTNEHFRLLQDELDDGTLPHRAAERLANADVPPRLLDAVPLGRIVALATSGHSLIVARLPFHCVCWHGKPLRALPYSSGLGRAHDCPLNRCGVGAYDPNRLCC